MSSLQASQEEEPHKDGALASFRISCRPEARLAPRLASGPSSRSPISVMSRTSVMRHCSDLKCQPMLPRVRTAASTGKS
eukprot:952634-Pyramimonas_sp.AAC.1